MTKHNTLIFIDSNVLIEAMFVSGHPASAVTTLAFNRQTYMLSNPTERQREQGIATITS